ncbi:hypothetical protein [Streptomyces jumonjinensis]|uniref:hypothetical protein n=1 Tax=Streptomyces jumonjinensis TaxID=1945 RepID=UPI0037A96B73
MSRTARPIAAAGLTALLSVVVLAPAASAAHSAPGVIGWDSVQAAGAGATVIGWDSAPVDVHVIGWD